MKPRALLALLALAGACGDDGGGHYAIPCDITQDACRRSIFLLTASMRQQRGARLPASRIITRDQYAQETRQEIAMQTSRPVDQQYEVSLKLLKFLPEGTSAGDAMADSNINGVAAYYSSETKSVTIISDAVEDPYSGSLTLSHEYTHALQDERQGLEALGQQASSTDQIMAETSLVEGEAVILSDAVMARAQGLEYDYPNEVSSYLDRLLNTLLVDIAKSDATLTEAQLVLPYPVGGRPVAIAYNDKGADGVNALFQGWPDTLAEWIDSTRTNLPAPQRCQNPDPPASYQRIVLDSYGATGLIAFEVLLGADGPTAYERARAWASDTIAVFGPVDQSTQAALAWRITLIDAAHAQALWSRIQAANLGVQAVQQDSEVVITAASAAGVLDAWTVRNDCSTGKSLDAPQAHWPHLPRYLARASRSLARARQGAEGGIRTRTP